MYIDQYKKTNPFFEILWAVMLLLLEIKKRKISNFVCKFSLSTEKRRQKEMRTIFKLTPWLKKSKPYFLTLNFGLHSTNININLFWYQVFFLLYCENFLRACDPERHFFRLFHTGKLGTKLFSAELFATLAYS